MIGHAGVVNIKPADLDVIPRNFPPLSPLFTNRDSQLDELHEAANRHPMILLQGARQVGKTQLAAKWASSVIDRFPHGTVYCDLNAYGPRNQPDLLRALVFMLTIMKVHRVPNSIEECRHTWLSVTRMHPPLVILDNINDPAVLKMLRPAETATLVMIGELNATRFRTEGAEPIHVTPFSIEHSKSLVSRTAGAEHWLTDPDGDALFEACDGRPRTVSLLAACLAEKPDLTVTQLLDEILRHPASRRADAAAAIAERIRIEALAPDQHELFRLLSTSGVTEFSRELAAHLAGTDSADDIIESLHAASLVTATASERWKVVPPAEADPEVMTTVVDWYRRVARIASLIHTPGRLLVTDRQIINSKSRPTLSKATALTWLETELSNLDIVQQYAYDRGWDEAVVSLEESLWVLYLHRSLPSYRERTTARAIKAAQRLGDPAAQSRAHGMRSRHLVNLRDYDEAMAEARTARRLARIAQNSELEASAFEMIARVHAEQEQWDQAKQAYRHSLAIYLHLGDLRGIAVLKHQLAKALIAGGEYNEAAELLHAALMSSIANERPRDLGNVLLDLGRLQQARHETHAAIDTYLAANRKLADTEQLVRLAQSLENLGDCYRATNNVQGATEFWQHAMDAHRNLRNFTGADLERLQSKMAELS
ncbi:hypothetical protein ACFQ3B_00070 [Stackebrandtia endophytica]|nr:hypothetical protein [Stackebrandtia endophytica]